jgi:predicted TIM-barrel fold metal-dependent hydrolase
VLDGRLLVDAHLHPARMPTLKPAWRSWAEQYGRPGWQGVFDEEGTVVPEAFDALLAAEGVDRAILLCEYSPKVTGTQPVEDLLPIVRFNPERFAFLANVNPHLHYPIAAELTRQVELGAVGLKIHPVHGGFAASDPMLYPAYQVCVELNLPLVVHCGTSTFPGSTNSLASPELLDPVLRDFPGLTIVLAHGGRGWWYDQAAFLALMYDNVWIELSGLPPRKLPEYYAKFDLARLARRFVFATDWPGVPGIARNARALGTLGLDDETLDLVLGGNALRVYPRLSTTHS